MQRALPTLLALAGAAACVTPPPASISTPYGAVRAPNPELALQTAEAFEAWRAELARLIPDLREGGVDVWVQVHPSAGPFLSPRRAMVDGFTLETFWRERPRIHVASRNWGDTLPHELVHALLGESWSTLPAAVEEGLADWASVDLGGNRIKDLVRLGDAVQACEWDYELRYLLPGPDGVGGGVEERRIQWSGGVERDETPSDLSLERILELRPQGYWHPYSDMDVSHFYGVGYVIADLIVERVGIEGLHALCVEARDEGLEQVPPDRILAAAGVVDEEHFAALAEARRHAARLGDLMFNEGFKNRVREMFETCPDEPPAVCLRTHAPEIRLDGGDPIPLEELPGFDAWLRAYESGR